MFYAKGKLSDTAEITVLLRDDNIFCACPACGRESCIDLAAVFSEGDLYSTSVYCHSCSEARLGVIG